MHGDLQLAAGRLVDVVGELGQVLGVEVGRRVGGRQVPLGLRRRGDGERRQRAARGSEGDGCDGDTVMGTPATVE